MKTEGYKLGEVHTLYCKICDDYTVWESEDGKTFTCSEHTIKPKS